VLGHGPVQCRPEADVLLQRQHRHLRELVVQQGQRIVARAVVDDHDVDRPALLAQALQRPPDPLGSVVVRYVNGWSHGSFSQ